jgi:hypothetical protein
MDKMDKTINEEEIIWCLWDWAEATDYVLCKWDTDLLPNLYKKDEVRFTYNQFANKWSYVSCTIFAAIWMLSDLINYEFSYEQIKEVDDLSYTKGRVKWQWWYVQSAVKLVADRYNNSELSKQYWKVAYYRISKYDDEIIEDCIDKLYTIDWNFWITSEYNKDKKDWMIDGTDFWKITSWHSADIIKKEWVRSVKDSSNTNVIYWLKHKLSELTNFWTYFYVYTLVSEDNFEEIKRLNEIKSECNVLIEHLWTLRHLVNDTNFQWILHYTADKLRMKIKDCNEMLGKLW